MTAIDVEKILLITRLDLLFKQPFFGEVILRLELVRADEWCSTMAVDGKRMYYNSNFVARLEKAELLFVMLHEVVHCVFEHIFRGDDRDPDRWNMAIDYATNGILVNEKKCGKMPTRYVTTDNNGKSVQRVGLYDPKYEGWSSEDIYRDLVENNVDIVHPLDDHLVIGQDDDRDESKPGPVKVSAEEAILIASTLKGIMLSAVQMHGAESVPGGLRRMVMDVVDPRMDWKSLLRVRITSTVKSKSSFIRPSRKSMSSGIILPGFVRGQTVSVHIAFDASGSINEEQIREFLGETLGIMDQFPCFRLCVWSFDVNAYRKRVYTERNRKEILEYDWIQGGGGTCFENGIFEFLKSEREIPKQLVVFTDGLPNGSWGDPHYCNTLFVINNPFNRNIVAPFGSTAYYKK